MAIIYETENFIVDSQERPFVCRTDGGHIRIKAKDLSITDRTKLSPKQAIESMRLTMIVGEAFEKAMNDKGVPVVKVNYQDMGNWYVKTNTKPYFHIHLFGRSKDAVKQIWPEAVYLPDRGTGFYEGFEPLNESDRTEIFKHINIVSKENKYSDEVWGLK